VGKLIFIFFLQYLRQNKLRLTLENGEIFVPKIVPFYEQRKKGGANEALVFF